MSQVQLLQPLSKGAFNVSGSNYIVEDGSNMHFEFMIMVPIAPEGTRTVNIEWKPSEEVMESLWGSWILSDINTRRLCLDSSARDEIFKLKPSLVPNYLKIEFAGITGVLAVSTAAAIYSWVSYGSNAAVLAIPPIVAGLVGLYTITRLGKNRDDS